MFLKYKTGKLAKEQNENKKLLQNRLKEPEGNLNMEDNIQSYNIYKKELDSKYNHIDQNEIGVSTAKSPKSSF